VLSFRVRRDNDAEVSESSFISMFGAAKADETEQQAREWASPVWFGPPGEELPVCVPLALVVARSASAVIALSHASAYSTGIAIEFVVQSHGLPEREAQRLFHEQHMPPTEGDPAPAYLRLGIELADGSRASNLGGRHHPHDPEHPPDGPVLMPHGGGGGSSGQGRVTMRPGFWMWPLPPPGVVRLICEWPLLDIPLTTVELDGADLRAASERAVKLWES
jgi:hypothetical protein